MLVALARDPQNARKWRSGGGRRRVWLDRRTGPENNEGVVGSTVDGNSRSEGGCSGGGRLWHSRPSNPPAYGFA
jgi:hypothetical protein